MQLTRLVTFTLKCHGNELALFILGEECYETGKSCPVLKNEQDKAKKFPFDEMEHLTWFHRNDKPGRFALQNGFDIMQLSSWAWLATK